MKDVADQTYFIDCHSLLPSPSSPSFCLLPFLLPPPLPSPSSPSFCLLPFLLPQDCFIVDTGSTAIYVWLGKGSSHQERKAAFKTALVHHWLVCQCSLFTGLHFFRTSFRPRATPVGQQWHQCWKEQRAFCSSRTSAIG